MRSTTRNTSPSRTEAPFRLLFVCYGNFCRSPMAEFVMRDLVRRAGLSDAISVASAATSSEDVGSRPHPETRRLLREHGLDCGDKRAVQMTRDDLDQADLVLIMDENNATAMKRRFGKFGREKTRKLLEFAGSPDDIPDPWITHDFDATYADIVRGCTGLLEFLEREIPSARVSSSRAIRMDNAGKTARCADAR